MGIWSRKFEGYVQSAYPELVEPMEWGVDQSTEIDVNATNEKFGDSNSQEYVSDLDAKLVQLQTALIALTDGEGFDICNNTGRNPLEGWRKLHRRFDPTTGGRKRNLLRSILSPGRCKWEDVSGALERWEELV